MNKDQFEGQWKSIKGKVKEKWGKLTDNDITQINGKREQLVGQLQKKYGYAKDKAEEELKNWEAHIGNIDEEETTSFGRETDTFRKKR